MHTHALFYRACIDTMALSELGGCGSLNFRADSLPSPLLLRGAGVHAQVDTRNWRWFHSTRGVTWML